MAKREDGKQNTTTASANPAAESPVTTDAMEQRVIAFAEQLGRIYGTVQAKAEGWMDREALNKQIAGVRDSAAELLEQLSAGVTSVTGGATKAAAKAGLIRKKSGPQRRRRRCAGQEASQAGAEGHARDRGGREAVEHAIGQAVDEDHEDTGKGLVDG